ncbi:MAG: class I SAM-dependent methyltransferase [Opitutaceae bacterium]
MNIPAHNRSAWDRQVSLGNRWTMPVDSAAIAAARRGEWSVVLTPRRPVSREWFGKLAGARVLALASGGGQQGPILAAAGASVTVLDNSPAQLAQDRLVAERDGLTLALELGEMTNLSRFGDETFDVIFHPCANGYIPEVRPVWRECFRVLRHGGRLLAGFTQPVVFLFDPEKRGGSDELVVHYKLPYADPTSLSSAELQKRIADGDALEFGHTLTDQIGGQLEAGFVLHGFFEDTSDSPLDRYINTYAATLAIKPQPTGTT